MELISCEQKKAIEKYAIETMGVPSIVLMENAALNFVKSLDLDNNHSFTIISGVGNNGGDGLAIARHLIISGKKIDLYIIGNLNRGGENFNINLNILKHMDLPIKIIESKEDLYLLKNSLDTNDITVDAIFGMGLNRDIDGLHFELISFINNYSKTIISVDIPSGLQCDTGDILSTAIKADRTITFHKMKIGLLDRKGYTGEIIVVPIGIPKNLVGKLAKAKA